MASIFLKSGAKFWNPLKAKQTLLVPLVSEYSNFNTNYCSNNSWSNLKSSMMLKSTVIMHFSKLNAMSVKLHEGGQQPRMFVGGARNFHVDRTLQDIFTVQDEKDFKAKVENSKKPVIVQFHATWCGPCKLLKPRLEKNLAKYADKVDLALVDIDELPEIAMRHNVGAVPAVMAIKNGEVFNKFVGLKDDDQIDKFLQESSK